jgi:predicted site-specific integrase-resolvase
MLTIVEASKRVRRDRRTLERWIADGELDVTVIRTQAGHVLRRYVAEAQLLSVLREKIAANPTRAKLRHDVTPMR